MRGHRLVKANRAIEAFAGEGARLFGGRWNHPGTPMVYAAESLSLAALETFVHFSGEERAIGFVAFALEIPEDCVTRVAASALPRDWRSEVAPSSTQTLGSEWQRSGKSVALVVPSVIVPSEMCVLLNPAHPDTKRIVVHYPVDFTFDSRLRK